MKKSRNKPMDDKALVAFLGRKIQRALNREDGDVSDTRQENMEYYLGAENGTEREGYSKYVSREAMETVEWILPSILRVFLSDDKLATFDPTGPEDEKQAAQETDTVNHFIRKANNAQGFLALHHWIKDALMNPNGYVKVYQEERDIVDVSVVTGIDEFGLQMLLDDANTEIIEQRSEVKTISMSPGQMQRIEIFDVKVRTKIPKGELRVDPVPPEECLVDNDLTTPDLDAADFVCHRTQKTFTDLVQRGLDPEELRGVSAGSDTTEGDEKYTRLFYEEESPDEDGDDDESMALYWVHECVARVDYDGDGLGEQRKILMVGDQIFENEEVNYQPFVSLSSILVPHKHTGMSYIDIVKDLQLLQTTLKRQLLDNLYRLNRNRRFISEDALTQDGATMEALLNAQAEVVPVRGPANMAVAPDVASSALADILPVIQHFEAQKTMRTGVSPDVAVDAGMLQEVRQDVFQNALDRASQRVEMVIRIFAETGFRALMLKVHQILRSHWDIEKTIKLRGEWVPVDPQSWRHRSDVTVAVGLGYNTKSMQLGLLKELLAIQKEAASAGLSKPKHLYNTAEKLIAAANLGDVRQYFVDPESTEYEAPEPAPDPNMILAQAQAKALESEAQYKQQKLVVDSQTAQQKAAIDLQTKQAELRKAEIELQMAQASAAADQQAKAAETAQKQDQIDGDKKLKDAQADKAMAEAIKTTAETLASVENGYGEAKEKAEDASN